jgi:molybdopterin-guanine dinucleotide biosynthesis protein A
MGVFTMQRGAIILAGGQNQRMGQQKWLLKINGETFIERIVHQLTPHLDTISIVLARQSADVRQHSVPVPLQVRTHPKIQIIRDDLTGIGPLSGIKSGLLHCPSEYNFIVASDMPFIRWKIVEYLFQKCIESEVEAVIPTWLQEAHPLCAVYRTSALRSLNIYLQQGGHKVMEWVTDLNHILVPEVELQPFDPHGYCFMNVNTPQEYESAAQLARLLE